MTRPATAQHEAARHVAAYLLRPTRARETLTISDGVTHDLAELTLDASEIEALLQRERAAIDALACELLERQTLRPEEADLIVDVARGDATAADLRDYRVITRQSRCGLG